MKMRKRWLIYPKFQLQLIAVQLLVIIGISTPLWMAVRRTFLSLNDLAARSGIPEGHAYFRLIELQKELFVEALWLPMAIGAILSIGMTIWLSDRLAGPIVRLRQYFSGLSEGADLKPVQFRKGDFFEELPPVINEALEKRVKTSS